MTIAEILQITNRGTKTFTGRYGRRDYKIEPGRTLAVQFDCVHGWCGDPAATVDPSSVDYRTEADRISAKYGAYDDVPLYPDLLPNLYVETQDGEQIVTPLDVLAGRHTGGKGSIPETEGVNVSELTKLVKELQAKVESLEADIYVDEDAEGVVPAERAGDFATPAPTSATTAVGFDPNDEAFLVTPAPTGIDLSSVMDSNAPDTPATFDNDPDNDLDESWGTVPVDEPSSIAHG